MKLRTLGLAAGASLVLLVPCVLLLQDDTSSAPAPTARTVVADPSVTPTTPTDPHATTLAPPPAAQPVADAAPVAAPTPQAVKPKTPRQLSPTARLVALRKLEDRRPEETVSGAEELVREIAAEPAERTVLLAALGILDRVPGGDSALLRLAASPPTPEVAELAQGYLDRRN